MTPEPQHDDTTFRILRELNVLPEASLLDARTEQLREMKAGGKRGLLEILRERGAIDSAAEAKVRSRMTPPATPIDPTVAITPHWQKNNETLLDMTTPAPGESRPTAASEATVAMGSTWEKPVETMLDLKTPADVTQKKSPPTDSGRSTTHPPGRRPSIVEAAVRDPKNRFGEYVLVTMVGRGGMGAVYRAWDNRLRRYVALKVIHSMDPESVERFRRESQIAAKLQHPSIATVFDAGEVHGRPYIAMQFIEGTPVNHRPVPLRRAIEVIRDTARAIQHAHDHKVIHRDIKPNNLLVDNDGKVFVTDFGIAKETNAGISSQFSVTGSVLGTPQYMSPEQASGDPGRIDTRTDVYSLGATLFALLAGRPPFGELNVTETILAVLQKKPPAVSTFNSAVSPELEFAIERAMAKDVTQRCPTAGAFADELDRLLREERYSGRFGLHRRLARRWGPVALAGVIIAASLPFVIGRLGGSSSSSSSEGPALKAFDAATMMLGTVEREWNSTPPAARRERMQQAVFGRLEHLVADAPNQLGYRVSLARAHYAAGDRDLASKQLAALTGREGEDYRISFLPALMALEVALAAPPPRPAIEGPDWDEALPPLDTSFVNAFATVAQAKARGPIALEQVRDAKAAGGIVLLLQSKWGEAADELAEAARAQSTPAVTAAWSRASYLARRFEVTRNSSLSVGRPERLFAGLALAMADDDPEGPLGLLLAEADRRSIAWIQTALARVTLDAGHDPEAAVQAGLRSIEDGDPGAEERRGILLACRQRRLALSAADIDEGYREIAKRLGDAATWTGRLAAAETLLAESVRVKNPRPLLDDVVTRTSRMAEVAKSWPAPRLLRALAWSRMGKAADALADISASSSSARGRLTAAAVGLALAQDRRRDGGDAVEAATAARLHATALLSSNADHADALALAAGAEVVLAQFAADDATQVAEAIEHSSRALAKLPGQVHALEVRAAALYLRGQGRARKGGDSAADDTAALADLNAVLATWPDRAPALCLRGIVHFSLKRSAEAAADWRKALEGDPGVPAEDLREWIGQADLMKR